MATLRPPPNNKEDTKESSQDNFDDIEQSPDSGGITVNQVNRARASWFITFSLINVGLLILGLILPSWVSITVPYNDNILDVHGTLTYLFGLKGATVTGVYNSVTQVTYMSFADNDAKAANPSLGGAVRSADATLVLVIIAAVYQGLSVVLFRRTRVQVDGKDTCRRVLLQVSVFVSIILEVSALLAYHVGNGFISQQRHHAISISLLGGTITTLIATLTDVVKFLSLFVNITSTPQEFCESLSMSAHRVSSHIWAH